MDTFLQALLNGLTAGGIYGLTALGLTIVFGIMRVVNFAHGDLVMLGMYAAFWAYELAHIPPAGCVAVAGIVLFAVGALLYHGVVRRVHVLSEEGAILLTVGLSLVIANSAQALWGTEYRTVNWWSSEGPVALGSAMIGVPRLVAVGVATAATAACFWIIGYTRLGRAIRAVTQDMYAASLMGIRVSRVAGAAFGLGAAMAGLAGALLLPLYYAFPTVGFSITLRAFIVVVLGGLGDLRGAVIAALVLALAESFSAQYLPPGSKDAVALLLFVAVLVLRPRGITGSSEARAV